VALHVTPLLNPGTGLKEQPRQRLNVNNPRCNRGQGVVLILSPAGAQYSAPSELTAGGRDSNLRLAPEVIHILLLQRRYSVKDALSEHIAKDKALRIRQVFHYSSLTTHYSTLSSKASPALRTVW